MNKMHVVDEKINKPRRSSYNSVVNKRFISDASCHTLDLKQYTSGLLIQLGYPRIYALCFVRTEAEPFCTCVSLIKCHRNVTMCDSGLLNNNNIIISFMYVKILYGCLYTRHNAIFGQLVFGNGSSEKVRLSFAQKRHI